MKTVMFTFFGNWNPDPAVADLGPDEIARQVVQHFLYHSAAQRDYSPGMLNAGSLARHLCDSVGTSVLELKRRGFDLAFRINNRGENFEANRLLDVAPVFVEKVANQIAGYQFFQCRYQDMQRVVGDARAQYQNRTHVMTTLNGALTVLNLLPSSTMQSIMGSIAPFVPLAATALAVENRRRFNRRLVQPFNAFGNLCHKFIAREWVKAANETGFDHLLAKTHRPNGRDNTESAIVRDVNNPYLRQSIDRSIARALSHDGVSGGGFSIQAVSREALGFTSITLRARPVPFLSNKASGDAADRERGKLLMNMSKWMGRSGLAHT